MKARINDRYRVAILIIWFAITCLHAAAQIPTGAIAGSVRDINGKGIVGALVTLQVPSLPLERSTTSNSLGEFRLEGLTPGIYTLHVTANGFATTEVTARAAVGSVTTQDVTLRVKANEETVRVQGANVSIVIQGVRTASSVEQTVIASRGLESIPLAARSFANIAYLSPMTEPVEPSDPTKARITAVSFGGSSGLNVDLSVDGGDNNDDYIGGFLQNYSSDAMQEFVVRTAQFDADTSRTNGGSVIISTKRGTDDWHGSLAAYIRGSALNARNTLDNPEPNPKQPFSRQNGVVTLGGPMAKGKIWFFSSLEYVNEDASIAYSSNTQNEFQALAQLAAMGEIPGVSTIHVPSFVGVPFRDVLFDARVDWAQSQRSQWFFRGALDRSHTNNDLLQQASLPSVGAHTTSNYWSFLISNQFQFDPTWLGSYTFQANSLHNEKARNSNLGFALVFPFSASFLTTSGFETFGDNQFATPITAFPILRDQQKYQLRYDLSHSSGTHSPKFGINFIHEPVLSGKLATNPEQLVTFSNDPSYFLANNISILPMIQGTPVTSGGNGVFTQNVQRLGFYGQDSWRVTPNITVNYGLRYDTTFGLFRANGADQSQNPGVALLNIPRIPVPSGIPHDYRGAVAPRLGVAYAPGQNGNTVIRAGIGLFYNDLAQNGWVDALRAVVPNAALNPGDQAAVIDPHYKTPYALQASAGVEHSFNKAWMMDIHYLHEEGVHQYRRYEYATPNTLPAAVPNNISVFKTDNRSRYDGVSFVAQHNSKWLNLIAHYTLANATTWGATVGELFDYVNGVSDVRNPFGPGDYGPSGEDVRHRFVLAATVHLPYKFEMATLSQFESARPFTIVTPIDVNNDGISTNDRAVVNGVQTSLDEFRGTPLAQVDMRVSREFKLGEHVAFRPFAEFFNLLNRTNPGNNFVGDISALPTLVNDVTNATAFCLNPACTTTAPITSLKQLRVPAGALGDFFGPGTTVGIPFAAQLGFKLSF